MRALWTVAAVLALVLLTFPTTGQTITGIEVRDRALRGHDGPPYVQLLKGEDQVGVTRDSS